MYGLVISALTDPACVLSLCDPNARPFFLGTDVNPIADPAVCEYVPISRHGRAFCFIVLPKRNLIFKQQQTSYRGMRETLFALLPRGGAT
jgi:hypothetical protein